MHVHILGICGTFMAGIAALARTEGHRVTGSDLHAWPPMSDQLREQGIEVWPGYDPAHLDPLPDQIVVGNALTRGNPVIEHILNEGLACTSGPAWLAEHVLRNRWVLAVAGTHGKTTTSAMLAWMLESAGHAPGFLVGGVPQNFGVSARRGESGLFVIEADEYDTAFFDKRSKFVHYRPRTLIINNIEHDHVDIFPDLAAIFRQFHHLVRTVPGQGRIIHPYGDANVGEVLRLGCWSDTETVGSGGDWTATLSETDGSRFEVVHAGRPVAEVKWALIGGHNVHNALAALAAAAHVGVTPDTAAAALGRFVNVKRRLEVRGIVDGITVYDDFAHHPTAIETTIAGLRSKIGDARILAVLDLRSNSMRAGLHRDALGASIGEADQIWLHSPRAVSWDIDKVTAGLPGRCTLESDVDSTVKDVVAAARTGDHVLIMSNGDFGGIHQRLIDALRRHRREDET